MEQEKKQEKNDDDEKDDEENDGHLIEESKRLFASYTQVQ